VRYVLFILDKYLGAKRLVEEMKLVSRPAAPPVIELPIHK